MNLRRIPLGLVVVLAALAAHAGAWHLATHVPSQGFVYDDENVILLNTGSLKAPGALLRGFVDAGAFSGTKGNAMYRPVTFASEVVDARLRPWIGNEPDPRGWHLTNLLLHAAVCLVLYHLLIQVLRVLAPGEPFGPAAPDGPAAAAFLGATWFALLPANSEVVNYVSARSESLAALFFLLALWAHHAAWREGVDRFRRVLLVAGSCVAAFLSFGAKETGALLPLVAAALELWARPARGEGPSPAARPPRALPLLGALGAYLWVRHVVLGLATVDLASRAAMTGAGVDPMVGGGRTMLAHLLTQARVAIASGLLALFPVDLAPDHGVRVSAALDPPTLLAILILAGGALLVVLAARRGSRAVPLAAAWAAAAAAPSFLAPLNVLMNEHRLYLPATGIALGVGIATSAALVAAARARAAWAGGLSVVVVLCGFTMVDWGRAYAWADPPLLWAQAVDASPSSWRNGMHLGVEYYRLAERASAELDARKDRTDVQSGFLDEEVHVLLDLSLEQFRRAHGLYERAFETRLNMGFAHLFRGILLNRDADPDAPPPKPEDFREAVRWFTLAEESSPGSFRALYNRATAMALLGQVKEATAEFERLSQDKSRTTMYAWPLADLYRRAGRVEDALAQFDFIERTTPEEAGTLALRRAEVLTGAGKFKEGIVQLDRARELLGLADPGPPLFMARLLVATGLPENLETVRVLWASALDRGHRPGPKDRNLLRALGKPR